jgi:hypothetical protein
MSRAIFPLTRKKGQFFCVHDIQQIVLNGNPVRPANFQIASWMFAIPGYKTSQNSSGSNPYETLKARVTLSTMVLSET